MSHGHGSMMCLNIYEWLWQLNSAIPADPLLRSLPNIWSLVEVWIESGLESTITYSRGMCWAMAMAQWCFGISMNGYDPISVQPQRRATVMSDKIILHIYILFIILAYLLYLYQTINQSTLQPSVLGQIKPESSSLNQTHARLSHHPSKCIPTASHYIKWDVSMAFRMFDEVYLF